MVHALVADLGLLSFVCGCVRGGGRRERERGIVHVPVCLWSCYGGILFHSGKLQMAH